MEFRIMGPVQLWAHGRQFDLGSRKERSALAALVYEQAGRPVSADTLVERLWGADHPDNARGLLYSHISRVRKALRRASGEDRDWVPFRSGAYTLSASADAVDLWRFRSLREQARTARDSGDDQQAAALLREAERLWRGDPLAGLDSEWAGGVRRRLEEDLLSIRFERIEAELRVGRHTDLVGELFDLADQHPLVEEPTRLLMMALYRSGRGPDAFRAYRQFWRRLTDEVGSEPTAGLRDLHQRMLNSDPGLMTEAGGRAPASAGEPVPGAPPPAMPAAGQTAMPTAPASSLPRDNPDFTGRAAELGTLAGWLGSGQARSTVPVILISGMPGTGKTALAVHAAHVLGDQYPHKLHIELHAHDPHARPADPAAALGTALRTLGIPTDSTIPPGTEERAALWRSRARGVLIVLDDALNAAQVTPLLPGIPGCAVLITSRYRSLNLPGESALPLATLPLADAASLFTRVAGTERADDPAAVAAVAGMCGYLPIEIQLAATQLRHHPAWTIADLIARLQGIRAEDRGLTASLELSYRHLTPERQRLLRRLALHPGGSFSGYAAIALAGSIPAAETRRSLDVLVDYHLIDEPARGRYAFHGLIREYAAHLTEASDTERERQHAMRLLLDYYVSLADQADRVAYPFHRRIAAPGATGNSAGPPRLPALRTPHECRAWAAAERAGLLHAARYAAANGFPGHAGWLPHLLASFLDTWGDWSEAIDLHRLAVRAWRQMGNPSGETTALIELCVALGRAGRCPEAVAHGEGALAIAREMPDQAAQAEALSALGLIMCWSARYPEALAHYEEALALWRVLGDRHGEADALCRAAFAAWRLRRSADAMRRVELALTIYRELGDLQGETNSLNNLGEMQQDAGCYEQALANYQRALSAFRDIGDRQGEAIAFNNIGDIYRRTGHSREALWHYRIALTKLWDIGDRRSEAETLINMAGAVREAGDHSAAVAYFQKALVIAHEIAEHYLRVLAHLGLGEAHLAAGDHGSATEDFRSAIELSQKIGDPDSEARATRGLWESLRHIAG